jgi:hypothetical protein
LGTFPQFHPLTLEGVYLENLKLVLFLDETGHTNSIDKMFAIVKRVPIS